MIRFSVILSVVAVAVGLLIAGAVSATLMLVYLAIGVASLALLMLIAGVVIWGDAVFGAQARREAEDGEAVADREQIPVAVAAGSGTVTSGPAAAPLPAARPAAARSAAARSSDAQSAAARSSDAQPAAARSSDAQPAAAQPAARTRSRRAAGRSTAGAWSLAERRRPRGGPRPG